MVSGHWSRVCILYIIGVWVDYSGQTLGLGHWTMNINTGQQGRNTFIFIPHHTVFLFFRSMNLTMSLLLLLYQNKLHRSYSRTLWRPSSMTSFLVLRLSLMPGLHIDLELWLPEGRQVHPDTTEEVAHYMRGGTQAGHEVTSRRKSPHSLSSPLSRIF